MICIALLVLGFMVGFLVGFAAVTITWMMED